MLKHLLRLGYGALILGSVAAYIVLGAYYETAALLLAAVVMVYCVGYPLEKMQSYAAERPQGNLRGGEPQDRPADSSGRGE